MAAAISAIGHRSTAADWRSACNFNAYTRNHELIAAKETGAFKGFALHAVDAVGVVHAMLLRVQALLLPNQDAGAEQTLSHV